MKLVTYKVMEEIPRLGFLYNSHIYDVERTTKYFEESARVHGPFEMLEVLNMDGDVFRQISKTYRLIPTVCDSTQKLLEQKICYQVEHTSILLPFTPRAVICSGNNYRDHLQEKEVKDAKDQKGDDIELFLKLPECFIGPYDAIVYSTELTEKLDYENELAVVIGREAWKLSPEEAQKCIFGYTVCNDLSARDRQMTLEGCMKTGLSKNFDGCGVLGPCIVTADEFQAPLQLEIITKVNGQTRQRTNTKHMINLPAFLVSHFSNFFKLKPGYVLSTGTCGGTAWSTDPELGGIPYERSDIVRGGYLNPGDTVTCSIDGIGEICNPIVE